MADDTPQLEGDPQVPSRMSILHNFIYNNLLPEYLKDTPPSPMPPEGTTPGKIGPPSGAPPWSDIAGKALPDVLSALVPEVKAAGAAKAIMAGPLAKTANLAARDTADKMLQAGHSPELVHAITDWFQGKDTNLKHEIPGSNMMAKSLPQVKPGTGMQGQVANFVNYPELFKAYPETQNLRLHIDPDFGKEGMYHTGENAITIGGDASKGKLTPVQQGVLEHELQHYVQLREGFDYGSSPDWAYDDVRRALNSKYQNLPEGHPGKNTVADAYQALTEPTLRDAVAFQMYKRQPGEVEARNAQNRLLFDKFGLSANRPMTESYDDVADLLKQHGIALDSSAGGVGRPIKYSMREWKTETPVDLQQLPTNLRSVVDRLGTEVSPHKLGEFLQMLGERKYPWKTEDVPRYKQFNYIKHK